MHVPLKGLDFICRLVYIRDLGRLGLTSDPGLPPFRLGTWLSATRLTPTRSVVNTTKEGVVSVSKLTPQGWAFYAVIIGSPPRGLSTSWGPVPLECWFYTLFV